MPHDVCSFESHAEICREVGTDRKLHGFRSDDPKDGPSPDAWNEMSARERFTAMVLGDRRLEKRRSLANWPTMPEFAQVKYPAGLTAASAGSPRTANEFLSRAIEAVVLPSHSPFRSHGVARIAPLEPSGFGAAWPAPDFAETSIKPTIPYFDHIRDSLKKALELLYLGFSKGDHGTPTKPIKLVFITQTHPDDDHSILRDRSKLLKVFEAFTGERGDGTSAIRLVGRSGAVSNLGDGLEGKYRTLSLRALDRVWTSVAKAWAQGEVGSFEGFFETFREAFVEAVRREIKTVDPASAEFEDIPSTFIWVHGFSVHTGVS